MKRFDGFINWSGAFFMLVLMNLAAGWLGEEIESLLSVATFMFVAMLYFGRNDRRGG
jgi:hypothetical protein